MLHSQPVLVGSILDMQDRSVLDDRCRIVEASIEQRCLRVSEKTELSGSVRQGRLQAGARLDTEG